MWPCHVVSAFPRPAQSGTIPAHEHRAGKTTDQAPVRGLLLLAVALAAIVFVYPLLLASKIPLLDPDEGLHASIAQEMAQGGDWLVPRLMGKPFLDKPILYFWAKPPR